MSSVQERGDQVYIYWERQHRPPPSYKYVLNVVSRYGGFPVVPNTGSTMGRPPPKFWEDHAATTAGAVEQAPGAPPPALSTATTNQAEKASALLTKLRNTRCQHRGVVTAACLLSEKLLLTATTSSSSSSTGAGSVEVDVGAGDHSSLCCNKVKHLPMGKGSIIHANYP